MDPVPVPPGPAAVAPTAQERQEPSPVDLILPIAVAGATAALAGYAYLRRTRRARTRTTPGGEVSARPPVASPAESERQARAALVAADDCVRTSGEEIAAAEAQLGAEAVEPFARALRAAQAELSAAFAIRLRYEQGVPEDEAARRQALVGVVGRCAEAGRRLDAEADAFDRMRGLERGTGGALETAEARFQELAGRTGWAEESLGALRERFASSAVAPVLGFVEQAKNRLVFATTQLNAARQRAGSGDERRAVRHLRAAEGALAQADVFVSGVERLGTELRAAAERIPAVLTDAEAQVAVPRAWLTGGTTAVPPARMPAGELHARLAHADAVLAAVREESARGSYNPVEALRRVARAVEPLGVAAVGEVPAGARLAARSATGAAEDFVATHRGAVGAQARTRLAEAVRLLAEGDAATADDLAREARELAERDVRTHGNPYAGTAEHASGLAGAVLGGVLLADEPDGGPPASFGGPTTRARLRMPQG
ncbi:hypothetical protein [Streptomyces sp. V3I7]|uniref:hypothetical protein n=1 Tax=Streptomyces sp. V3I7 TaxID=3042278 RepID=UPI0027D7EC02|nr:hypothetical protein [Streptomyces sp. V3I7]